jgi:putative ABC transport system permease protein
MDHGTTALTDPSTLLMNFRASFNEAFWIAIASLRAAKLRSFLTLLGIILSTTTLIAVMSVIHGMNRYVADKIADLGAGGFLVVRMAFFGDFDPKKFLEMLRKNPQLKIDEFEFIKSQARLVGDMGMRSSRQADLTAGGIREDEVQITGGSTNLNVLSNIQTESGRYFSDSENFNRRMVAFIGSDIKDRFFATVDPIGKTLNIAGRPYTVIGVAKRMGSVFGQSQDNFVHIPISTFFKQYSARSGLSFAVQAIDQEHIQQAMDEVRVLMRTYRHLPPGREDNFTIFASDSIMGLWERLTSAIAATAVGVVSVFMVVGGVVIMNIMLAVVSERTVEIGVAIAWVTALIVRQTTPVPMELPPIAIFLGVGISAVVGLFFGIYPAHRASKLDPIEALRAER